MSISVSVALFSSEKSIGSIGFSCTLRESSSSIISTPPAPSVSGDGIGMLSAKLDSKLLGVDGVDALFALLIKELLFWGGLQLHGLVKS